jgi:protein translocase SecG subunit
MLSFFTILLTIALVLDCLILGLLILIQLPKKEAGVGVAFGGGATDALFGAGSGNALTKLTKYTATAFFIMVIVLQIMKVSQEGASTSATRRAFDKLMNNQSAPAMPPTSPSTPAATNLETAPAAPATNAPTLEFNMTNNAAPAPAAVTNVPSAPAK